MYEKYNDIIDDLRKRISGNMKYFSVFKEKEVLSDSDSDSDSGYDFNSYLDVDSYSDYFPVFEVESLYMREDSECIENFKKIQVFYYLIIKDLNIFISTYNKNEKAKVNYNLYFKRIIFR